MAIETWKVLVGVIVVIAIYFATTSLLGTSQSAWGILLIAVFSAIGIAIGQRIGNRAE